MFVQLQPLQIWYYEIRSVKRRSVAEPEHLLSRNMRQFNLIPIQIILLWEIWFVSQGFCFVKKRMKTAN